MCRTQRATQGGKGVYEFFHPERHASREAGGHFKLHFGMMKGDLVEKEMQWGR